MISTSSAFESLAGDSRCYNSANEFFLDHVDVIMLNEHRNEIQSCLNLCL